MLVFSLALEISMICAMLFISNWQIEKQRKRAILIGKVMSEYNVLDPAWLIKTVKLAIFCISFVYLYVHPILLRLK